MNPPAQNWKNDTVNMEAPRILALHSCNHGLRNCASKASQRSRRAWQMHWSTKAASEKTQHYEPKERFFKHETIVVCSTQNQHAFKELPSVESADTCSALETNFAGSIPGELEQADILMDPENVSAGEDECDDTLRMEEAIVTLKECMQTGSEMMDNALEQTSILKTELAQLQDDLHRLCSEFMSDDLGDGMDCTAGKKISKIPSSKTHKRRNPCDKRSHTVIHPMEKPEGHVAESIEGILKSTVSVESCGFQEFLAAACIVPGENNFEEHVIVPLPRTDDHSTSLAWSKGLDTILSTQGSVSLSSVSLQSVAVSIDDGNSLCSESPKEENSDPIFSERDLSQQTHVDDCSMGMCESGGSGNELVLVDSRIEVDTNERIEQHMFQSDCSKWLSEISFGFQNASASFGSASSVHRDSISKLDSAPYKLDKDSFSSGTTLRGSNVHCEKVEVFEHCVCNACEGSVWSASNASDDGKSTNGAWIDVEGVLPSDSAFKSDCENTKLFNKSSQSAWNSAKASLERYRPVESLILPDIEAHAPRVLSGTWDSARQYDISKTILGNKDKCNFKCYDGQVHNLFYRMPQTPSEDILRSCDSPMNFGDSADRQFDDDTLNLKLADPRRTENKLKSTGTQEGLGKGVGSKRKCNTSSGCNANLLPCSVDKGEHASSILSDFNKCESKCSSSAGRWLDRVYQGFSTLANGIGINGVAAEDTVVSGNANCNEFELVEMNGGVEWEEDDFNFQTSCNHSLQMGVSRSNDQPSWFGRIWSACQGLVQIVSLYPHATTTCCQ